MGKPLAIDLYCGLGGWAAGFLAEGYNVIGFDIERHDYGTGGYPGQLVLQDVLTLHGSQFRDAAVIVASPPCQAYSYRTMPWKRAKALPPPSNELFDACFRIQREAVYATGRDCPACYGLGPRHRGHVCPKCNGTCWITQDIPLVVENVKGAQPWVGRARWHYGSFYLWGDVPALMPPIFKLRKSEHEPLCETPAGTGATSWFFGNSKHGGRFYGQKIEGYSDLRRNGGKGVHMTSPSENRKGMAIGGKRDGPIYGGPNDPRRHHSGSNARKAASAQIAKIPLALSTHLARVYHPEGRF